MREKIIRFSIPSAAIPEAYIALHYHNLTTGQLNNIEIRLERTIHQSLRVFSQANIPAPFTVGPLRSQVFIHDNRDAFHQNSPKSSGGAVAYAAESERAFYSGRAHLYKTDENVFKNLEHELAHCIQYHWLGRQLFISPKRYLESFIEGLADVCAHEGICFHTLECAKSMKRSSDKNFEDITHSVCRTDFQYDQSYLMVFYMVEKKAEEFAEIIAACQKNDVKAAEKKLSLFATKYSKSFAAWIDGLQQLEKKARYLDLYCPVDRVGDVDHQKLQLANQFFRQQYTAPQIQSRGHRLISRKNVAYENLLTAVKSNNETAFTLALTQKNLDFDQYDNAGLTLLHHAVQQKNKKIIGLLFSAKVDVNIKSLSENETPFEIALRNAHKETILYFLEKLELQTIASSALFKACCILMDYQKFDILENVLLFGDLNSIPDFQDAKGLSLLHHAVKKNYESVMWLLESSVGLVHSIDQQGNTPLHTAIQHTKVNLDIVRELLRYGASIKVKNDKGITSLQAAIDQKSCDTVKFLISVGIKIDNNDLKRMALISKQIYDEIVEFQGLASHKTYRI